MEIVEVGEHAEFAEAADTGQESEPYMFGGTFEVGVDRSEFRAVMLEVVGFPEVSGKRFVVFVDEYHHLPSGLLMCCLDDVAEASRQVLRFFLNIISCLPLVEQVVQYTVEDSRFRELVGV